MKLILYVKMWTEFLPGKEACLNMVLKACVLSNVNFSIILNIVRLAVWLVVLLIIFNRRSLSWKYKMLAISC
jgi:hypothetical protein